MTESSLSLGSYAPSVGAARSSLDRIVKALESRGLPARNYRPDSFMAGCPVHEDSTPSLHVNWRKGQRGGGVLLFCHGCQAGAAALVEALGLSLSDLFDEPLPERDRNFGKVGKSPARRLAGQRRGKLGRLPALIVPLPSPPEDPQVEHSWTEVERYPYVDLQGRLVEEVIREECAAEGRRHKRFRQLFATADGRRVKRKPANFFPVLYRAQAVARAVQGGEPVWVTEGEKDVHTAEAAGVVATTNAQGGKSFPDELVDCLEGAKVIVVLDRDATGWARGVELHRKLAAVNATIRLKLPAVEDAKADLTDHIEAGFDLEALIDVSVEEVATWHALSAAQDKARSLEQAVEEARARWALSQGEASQENRRYAQRWTLETQIRQEALQHAVDQVYGHGMRVGTAWAGEAMELADQLLTRGTDSARRCHLDVGVPLPAALRPVAPTTPPADGAEPQHNGQQGRPTARALSASEFVADTEPSFAADKGAGATAPVFRVLGGQIVQWEADRPSRRRKDWDEDDEEEGGKLKVLLSTVVRVTVREYLEDMEGTDVAETELLGRASRERPRVRAPRTLLAVRLQFPDQVTGELMEVRVMADQWRDHSWLESLPGPPDYDHKKSGLDTLQRAILAISDTVEDRVLYRGTGWREEADGTYRFIHARGAITQAGHEDVDVAFDGAMTRFDLPDPTRDASVLRRAWLSASATMLDRLPDRVAAPLLGQIFRAILGHNPWVVTLIGPPGSYKTSIAAKAMHHFGERWEHHRPASSMSGNGDTLNALRFKLHHAKDVIYWMDDFAPTKGWLKAQMLLEETIRLVHDQEARNRSSQDGLSISSGTAPQASAICTSEVMPRAGTSGGDRALVVPMSRDDIDTALLFPLDEPLSRHNRALVMASFISHLAGSDLKSRRQAYMDIASAYADQLVELGETRRQADAVAQTWIGWLAITDFLVEASALTPEERRQLLVRVDAALRAAAQAAVNPDIPRTTGARVKELLTYALEQGIAYVDDVRTGDNPPWPMARRLGWGRTIIEADPLGNPLRTRIERSGMRLGYVLHDPGQRDRGRVLMCHSTQLEAVLKAAGATQNEKLEIDRLTACRALHDEGVLIADESEGKTRYSVKCWLYAESRYGRMVALHLDRIIGDDSPEDDDDPTDAGPGGPGESPFPIPGLEPADPQQLDVSDVSVEAGNVTSDHSKDAIGPDQPSEKEQNMPRQSADFVTRPWTDRDGVVGWTEPVAPGEEGPCVRCGRRSGVVISGLRIHLPCWENSSASDRAATAAPSSTTPTPTLERPAPAAPPKAGKNQAAAPGVAPKTGGYRAAAAVVDIDGIWCSNGDQLPRPETPLTHAGDLCQLAHQLRLGTQVTDYRAASGQIWVTNRLAQQMGIDVAAIEAAPDRDRDKVAHEVTKDSPMVTAAVADGYSFGRGKESLGSWTRVWKDTEKSVWIVLLPAMTQNADDVALIGGDPDPATLARRVGLLAGALNCPYQLTGSTTGLDLMKDLRWKKRDQLFVVREPVPPALLNVEADLSWCRPPTGEETQHAWVHAYDRSGSYLAGVSGLELGVGEPIHHPEGTAFTPKVPGYWRIEIPEAGDWRMPHPLDPRGLNVGKIRWVTTPGLDFAYEQGYQPEILEAYTWPERSRIFDPWYERIRDARTALDTDDPDSQTARDQLKQIYASSIGMLGSSIYMTGKEMYAPDRRHQIVAKARTNILRRVATIGQDTGRYPVAIVADTVLYTSNDPDPVASWPGGERWLGRELGRYKVEGSAPLASQLQFLTGGGYKGKDTLLQHGSN